MSPLFFPPSLATITGRNENQKVSFFLVGTKASTINEVYQGTRRHLLTMLPIGDSFSSSSFPPFIYSLSPASY